jgi:hypothetical protein
MQLTGSYDSENINFPCLREVMDTYEQKCGRLSDYALQYVKNFVEACEKFETEIVIYSLAC